MKSSSVFMVLITRVATGSSPRTPPLLAGCHPLTLPSSLTPAAQDLVCRKRPESLIPTKIISHYQSLTFCLPGKWTEEIMHDTNRPNNGFPEKVKSNHSMTIFTEAALNRAKQIAEALYLNNP